MLIESFAHTDVGNVREQNEDGYYLHTRKGLYAVIDGLGGHNGGLVATMETQAELTSAMPLSRQELLFVMDQAHQRIVRRQQEPNLQSAGAAFVAAIIRKGMAHICWAGDCRVYLLRKQYFRQLTNDHSYAQELLELGLISEHEFHHHPQKNLITKALGFGGSTSCRPSSFSMSLEADDILFMCSDGVTSDLDDRTIGRTLEKHRSDIQKATLSLSEKLKAGIARDNFTLLSLSVVAT